MKIPSMLVVVLGLIIVSPRILAQETAGIGVVLGVEGDNIIVRAVLPDSPAANSKSIHPGDRIISITTGDKPAANTSDLKLAGTVRLLRGPKGTPVYLTIIPAGKSETEARSLSFIRGELKELAAWGDGTRLATGTNAPNIQMLTLPEKASEYLTNYAGKIVVLEFWATWCGPCQEAVAKLETYSDQYSNWKDHVVLIAASVDETPEIAIKHLKTKGWQTAHHVWVARDGIKAYHIDGIPTTYIIDAKGRVASSDLGRLEIPRVVNRMLSGNTE